MANVPIPTAPSPQPSPKRYLVLLLDGTWCDRHTPNTVLNYLASILGCRDVVVEYLPGVGTFGSLTDRYIGGAVGVGVKKNMFNAYGWLITNYHPGDGILLLGYSRGAFTARSLAGLIHLVGIPPPNKKAGPELFKAYTSGKLKDRAIAQRMRKKFECQDVTIGFLGCFDTVGSLGIPDTGVLAFLKLSKPLRKRIQFHQTKLGNSVHYAFHAAAINETRASFMLTPMLVNEDSTRTLHQVFFVGSHGDLGTISADTCGLSIYPLASMLQHIKNAYPDFPFNEARLREAFPKDPADSRSSSPINAAELKRTQSVLWKLTGTSSRKPGSYGKYEYGYRTNESIDSSVGMMSDSDLQTVFPGFTLKEDNGTMQWENKETGAIIPVAPCGEFQAQLLGWTWPR